MKKIIYEEDREDKKITDKDMVQICLNAWLKMDPQMIIHSFKGLLYNVEDDFDFSAEAGTIRSISKELNPKSKTRKPKDVLADLSNAGENKIEESELNEDFLLTGKEREADDIEFPPNSYEDQWKVDEMLLDSDNVKTFNIDCEFLENL